MRFTQPCHLLDRHLAFEPRVTFTHLVLQCDVCTTASGTSREASHSTCYQKRFQAHRREHIVVNVIRFFVLDLAPKPVLGHPLRIPHTDPRNLRVTRWRKKQNVVPIIYSTTCSSPKSGNLLNTVEMFWFESFDPANTSCCHYPCSHTTYLIPSPLSSPHRAHCSYPLHRRPQLL